MYGAPAWLHALYYLVKNYDNDYEDIPGAHLICPWLLFFDG
jgi:hypothetical protein